MSENILSDNSMDYASKELPEIPTLYNIATTEDLEAVVEDKDNVWAN